MLNVRRNQRFLEELADFLETQTEETVTISKPKDQIYVPKDAVSALIRKGAGPVEQLVNLIAYGEEGPLVTEKSFVNTYRGSYRNPWTVIQNYREAQNRLETVESPDELSASQIARELKQPPQRVYHWLKQGSKPYALNGLIKVNQMGWVGFDLDSDIMTQLNKLVAWILSGGNITRTNMHPKFVLRGDPHQTLLDSIFDDLGVSFKEETSTVPFNQIEEEQHPHAHPGNKGALLGRVLSVLGAPVGSPLKGLVSFPPYLYVASKELKESFARILILNLASNSTSTSDSQIEIVSPNYSRGLTKSLYQFFQNLDGESVDVSAEGVVLDRSFVESLSQNGPEMEANALSSFLH